eukprot:SAG31_NODE_29_length_32663_cov_14.779695_2_plen_725_part_00
MSKGKKFANPMMDMDMDANELEEAASAVESAVKPVAPSKPELDQEELSDLAFAFEACDLDEGGLIDAEELGAVLRVFGANLSAHTVQGLMTNAKAGRKRKEAAGAGSKKKRKNKKGKDMTIESEQDLNFPEFVYLMTEDGLIDEYFPNGWGEGAYHMRLLKSAYATADLDGNNELEFEELSTSINSLHTGTLSDQDIEYMWEVMNPAKKPFLTFAEFLEGMVAVQDNANLNKKFHLFSPDSLMSLVLDTPVSLKEEKELMSGFTAMEKFGMTVLDRQVKEMSDEDKTNLLIRAQKGVIHKLTDEQRKSLKRLHHINVWQCLIAGFFSAAGTAIVENFLTYELNSDGVNNPDKCWPETTQFECKSISLICEPGTTVHLTEKGQCAASPTKDVIAFWSVMGVALAICCSFEIGAMYFYSIKNSVRVANAMDLRLKPMNRDRSFVGGSLVRAALELGNSQGVLFGVDPLREQNTRNDIVAVLFALVYVAKIALSGFVIKVLMKRLMTRGGAKFALPWAAVPATAGWNGFVGHIIMREAKLRGLGVAAAVEIFNDIVSPDKVDTVSDVCRIQLCRAVGCNIVKQRDMYPTKEILLRHAVGNLGLVRQGIIQKDESGVVDDVDAFLAKLKDMNDTELSMVMEVLLLATVLDGRARKRELSLLEEAVLMTDGRYHYNHTHIKLVAQRTRNMFPLTTEDIRDILTASPNMQVPSSFYLNEVTAKISGMLAC